MQYKLNFSFDGESLTASLAGEIDHHAARGLRGEIDTRLFASRPRELVLDFSGVRFMDSSGIALIIGRADVSREMGCRVKITGLSRGLLKLMQLSGIQRIENLTIE
ncbi:MAG: anti-sigma factor antagonist [Clostridia bacterium]|nr:anti-sigma factor antagonist [Clostridia bacterium]